MTFARPIDTPRNPQWFEATTALDLIPATSDPAGRGELMASVVGQFLLTQGEFAGRRLHEVMLPWQRDYLRYLFGNTDAQGNRRVRRAFLKVGKGSSKSTMTAAIALGFLMDCVARGVGYRGLIIVMSPSIATSNIVFGHVEQAILNDPHIRDQFRSKAVNRTITHVASGIDIAVRVASLEQAVGLRPLLCIYDELHLMALECRQANQVIDQLRRGQANAGVEALEIAITTAPPATASGIYTQTLELARKVRDGEIDDPSFFPVIFEPPLKQYPEIDLSNSSNWFWGMPSLKRTPGDVGTMLADEMVREYREAIRGDDPHALALFLSQRLGIEPADRKNVGDLVFQERWGEFEACPRLPPSDVQFLVCAFDPGGVSDPFAVALCWKDAAGRICFSVKQHLTQLGYDRAGAALKSVYDKARAEGELVIHETAVAMTGVIFQDANDLRNRHGFATLVFGGDAFGSAGFVPSFRQAVAGEFAEVKQGWTLTAALADLEAYAADRRICRVPSPLLAFNVANLLVEDAGNGRRFSKRDAAGSGTGELKIDGIMAALSALALHATKEHTLFDVAAMIG